MGISIGMVNGETRFGPVVLQDVVLAEQGERAADAGADDDGEPLGVDARRRRHRLRPGLAGGDDGDLLAAVEPAGPDPVDLLGRVGGQPRDELGRECP